MRRSAAPSRKYFACPCVTKKPKLDDDVHTKSDYSNDSARGAPMVSIPNATRDTASILGLLEDVPKRLEDPTTEHAIQEDLVENTRLPIAKKSSGGQKPYSGGLQDAEVPALQPLLERNSPDKRLFSVVWAKLSSRKHKKWEGDGTIEVSQRVIILKDVDGKEIGRSNSLKASTVEEGSRLVVGGKEVEVLDEITGPVPKAELKENAPVADVLKPKKKQELKFPSILKAPKKTIFKLGNSNPLVMPRPSHEHQWQYNTSYLPVSDVSVDPHVADRLRPHQREGVIFLYECMMGMRQLGKHGAILADEMGLGKTLQCIALLWTLLKKGPYGSKPVIHRVLTVTPSSLVANWEQEFQRWLGRERINVFTVDQKRKPREYSKLWNVPVMIISYEMFVRYVEDISKMKFDLLICDEGHRLKNASIKTSALLTQLECPRRILLTGTPIQNDLQEFYALVEFVNPGLLGTRTAFKQQFEDPIVRSRQPGVDEETQRTGEEKASHLNFLTSWFVLRRTQEIIDKYLPRKEEVVLFCKGSPLQMQLYKAAVEYWESREAQESADVVPHLSILTALRKICNHPLLVKASSRDTKGEDDNFYDYLSQFIPREQMVSVSAVEQSGKLKAVVSLLEEVCSKRQKIVLVSYYTQTLDLLSELCSFLGYPFCRLDGSTPTAQRMDIIKRFNGSYSNEYVFLLSAKAGGVGLNLTGASRLVLYDTDWNPASDLQAMSRIWRDGQLNAVYIYRLLTTGTIEEKIYQRQISKTGLSGTVVDPKDSNAIRLSREELLDLFTLHEDSFCVTHDLLKCNCAGTGQVLSAEDDEGETSERDCQLQLLKPSLCMPRMNQLFKWQHLHSPFDHSLLEELGLTSASDAITFIFKNSVT